MWSKIWSDDNGNESAPWPENVEQEVSAKKGARGHRFGVNKMANCEAAGPELVEGYWFNKTHRDTFYIAKRPARPCSFRKRPKKGSEEGHF